MKNIILFILFLMCLSACDEGRIYEKTIVIPQEGLTVKLTGNFSGMKEWPEKYSVVVAGFNDDSEYAIISKVVPAPDVEGGRIEMTLSGIDEQVSTLELCIINRLRKRVVSYYSMDELNAVGDTIYMEVGTVNVGMYNTIQEKVFDENCVACHGRSTSAAGGLFLTEGVSYDALVNVPSHVNEDMLLVAPNDVQNSFLHVVLNRNGDTHHDHVDILSAKTSLVTLIDDWIDAGAQP